MHPGDLIRIEKGYNRLFEEGHLSNEYRFRKKDGNYCWISDDLQMIRDAAGEPIEIVGAWNDITARKQLSEVLVAGQDRLVRLLSSAPAVIYSYRAMGDFAPIIISENIKNLLGYEPSEYLEDAEFWRSRVHPDDLARVEAESRNLYKNGRHAVEYRFRKKDDTYCWVNDEQRLIRSGDGQPIEVIGSWSDVTRRRDAELASRRSEQRLTDAIETISEGFRCMMRTISSSSATAHMASSFILEWGRPRPAQRNASPQCGLAGLSRGRKRAGRGVDRRAADAAPPTR